METNPITHKEIYNQLKAIFDGCDTIIDALTFCNMYSEKYPHMKSMIVSYTNGRTYKDNVDIKTKQHMMNDIYMCDSRDAAQDMIAKLVDRTTDDVYKKTLERIANKKQHRLPERKRVSVVTNISKKCPHCSHVLNMNENTNYVICGYHNPNYGFDWNGCGKDWCFHCNKMLCKEWVQDELHLQMNRVHDDECCSKHATNNGYKYPDNYCQCNNMNIHRNNNNVLMSFM